ncbi:hypothetical protein K450DRAFT_235699 [Umbelopsis ramanniana AG]|uniref:Uncharacterized protein n=1 Tax=Umbelopsis ramanniana AG TaxID=1314678 RepID=A0AAD5EBM4_UMBRA|nr:uncharacterized protein K450DRAFT_235699 [Umbelopsis ramanniana AG]KAI8580733.1 hypothetical protein K450DRAFT_235699 [Umbelopsis ramanniana AG]
MPSVDELISSIKAKSNSNSFLSQAKKRKSEGTSLVEKKKSRTIPAKNEISENDLLKKLNKFGEQFMQSVDTSSKKTPKKAKKVVEKMEVAPVDSELPVFPDEDLEAFEDEDEIDQLFGLANGQTVQEEETSHSTKSKGPEVVVFAEAVKKTITGSSKADYRAFMSSKVAKMEAPPPPPPKSVKEMEEEEENLAHDRELKELLATSKLLEEYEMEEMSGKERRKFNMNKLESLGVKKSKPEQRPIAMRLGMEKKQKERDEKKLQHAKNIGMYDKSMKHLYAAASKPKERKRRDRGIDSGIGKMQGSTLTLSKTEIKRVNRQDMKLKAIKRKGKGKGSSGGSKGGGSKGGSKKKGFSGGGKKGKR